MDATKREARQSAHTAWEIEGSIYEGMAAAVRTGDARTGATVAHFIRYDDAVDATRRVNSHDKLLAALEAFNLKEGAIVSGTADTLTIRVPIKALQDAAAAIAEARGEQP